MNTIFIRRRVRTTAVAVALLAIAANAAADTSGCGAFRSDISNLQTQVRTAELNRVNQGFDQIRNASQQFKSVCIDGLSAINTTQFGPLGSNLMTQAAKQLCNQVLQRATQQVNTQVGQVTDQYGRVTGSLSSITSGYGSAINSYGTGGINGMIQPVLNSAGGQISNAVGGGVGSTLGSTVTGLAQPTSGADTGGGSIINNARCYFGLGCSQAN